MVPVLVALLVLVTPLLVVMERQVRGQVVELAERRAVSVSLLAAEPDAGPLPGLDRLADLPGEQLAVVDRHGVTVEGADLPLRVRRGEVVGGALAGHLGAAVDRELGLVVAAAPVAGDGAAGAAVVWVPTSVITDRLGPGLGLVAALTVSLLVASALSARALARTVVRPLQTLDAVAARLEAGDLEARAHLVGAPPEITRLAERLDHSTQQIQVLLARQRSFVADVSHQLRTPLAAIRLRLENMALAAGDPDGRIAATIEEVDRLATIINDLLTLARAEDAPPRPEPVDVAAVVRERVAVAWTPLAAAAGVTLRSSATGPAVATGVPGGIRQVLDNLFANALQASPPDGGVDVTVEGDPHEVTVRIADRGPGMSDADRARAFERFWRGETRTAGGSGLGLPIAARLVEVSGGTIALHSREGGGLVAEIRLPAAGAADRSEGISS
ncbi:sensor histidine kinase [Egicoccus sp. AB-alg2]|uniref:sensor histidine kinase n=1 Tax=Egicoccus sp. AB-alg2 TaxID=3242693 RepID=UPI00359DB802